MFAHQEERAAHMLLSPTNGGMWDLVLSHAHDLISAFRDSAPCVAAAEEANRASSLQQQQHSASVPAASSAVSLWADGQCPRRLLAFAAAGITLVLQPVLLNGQPVCVLLVCVGAPPPPPVSMPPSLDRDLSFSPFASPIERLRPALSGTVGAAHDSACVVLTSHACGRLDELRRRAIGLGLDADTDCDMGGSRSEGDTAYSGLGTDRTIGCSRDTSARHKGGSALGRGLDIRATFSGGTAGRGHGTSADRSLDIGARLEGATTLAVPIAAWWARTLLLCDAFAAHAFADSAPLCCARALNESYRRSVANDTRTATAHTHAAASTAAESTCIDWSRAVQSHRGDSTAPPAQWSFPSVCELLFAAHADGVPWALTGRDNGGGDSLSAQASVSSSAATGAVGGAIAAPPVRRASMPRRPSLPATASAPVDAAPTQPSVALAASATVDSVRAPAADQSASGGSAAIASSVPPSSSAANGGNPRARRYHAQSAAASVSGVGADSGVLGHAAAAASSAAEGATEPVPQTFVPAPPPMAVRLHGRLCDLIGAVVSVCLLAMCGFIIFCFCHSPPNSNVP